MSTHIGAPDGAIAETVLLPGDPLRAKFIAETFLEDPVCYNNVRGMLGYTGTYKGKKVSVQGTGMGTPSLSIYVNELIQFYGCKQLIRVGSAGSIQDHVQVRDVVLASGACSDSSMNRLMFNNMDYAPIASFDLLSKAYQAAKNLGIEPHVGNILTTDTFYNDRPDPLNVWVKHNVLAVEMESSALYTLAAKFGVKALSVLTISDHIFKQVETSSEEREKTFTDMMKIALELA
ncbi:purine-nucleoside phosphorylase [Fusibacter sp. JL216-2]|uniref:purine-nucleoside phosphorylase n=1 Tax=Fusibacter sp. JL216-2 TaxID=3071453 RepID=UPI003D33ED02